MIAEINILVMIISGLIILYFYSKSVSPATLEKKIGKDAYKKCALYRKIASGFMMIPSINYIIYVFYPLPLSLPKTFSWGWPISIFIGILIALPAGYLFWRGMKDAGEETMTPKKEHKMYGSIYNKIRHPQAVGEVSFWWVIAFCLNSPHLVLISFIWLPVWYIMSIAEEKDLAIRYGRKYLDYKKRTGMFFPRRF